jgi:cytochrome c oxidase assembly factor CtaG
MVQHGLLQMIGPPLIVLGAPWLVIWRPFSLGGRRRVSRWIVHSRSAAPLRMFAGVVTSPPVAWMLFIGAIWISHLPALFDYAAAHPVLHETEHLVFVATGLLFWSRVFDSPPFHSRLTHVRRFAYLFSAGVAEAALSVVILSAHGPLYEPYRNLVPRPEHLTALGDQQLGGLMMMEPSSLPLLLAILWSLGTLLAPRRKLRAA